MTRLEKWGQAVRIALSIVTFIIAVLAFGFIQFSNGYDAGVIAAYDYLKESSHSTQQSERAWEINESWWSVTLIVPTNIQMQ
jgi:hypothetical protein